MCWYCVCCYSWWYEGRYKVNIIGFVWSTPGPLMATTHYGRRHRRTNQRKGQSWSKRKYRISPRVTSGPLMLFPCIEYWGNHIWLHICFTACLWSIVSMLILESESVFSLFRRHGTFVNGGEFLGARPYVWCQWAIVCMEILDKIWYVSGLCHYCRICNVHCMMIAISQ